VWSKYLYFLGFGAILLGFLLFIVGSLSAPSGSSGGFILIGPFPIVFGNGYNPTLITWLAVALAALMVAMIAVQLLVRSRESPDETTRNDNA
jgi:uncharacterized membrane protein